MAKNWLPKEIIKAIEENDTNAIIDATKRFPLAVFVLSGLNESGKQLLEVLPEYITLRKLDRALREDAGVVADAVNDDEEVEEEKEDEEVEVKKEKKQKGKKVKKQVEEEDDEDEDDDDDEEEVKPKRKEKKESKKEKKAPKKKKKAKGYSVERRGDRRAAESQCYRHITNKREGHIFTKSSQTLGKRE